MKPSINSFLFVSLLLCLVTGLTAQNVEYVIVEKGAMYKQTGEGTVILDPTPVSATHGGPWTFAVNVEGIGLEGLSAPVVSGPVSVDAGFFNGGALLYDSDDGAWRLGAPNANDFGAETKGALDAAFANGTYSLNVFGNSLSLNLSPDSYPVVPQFTLSGGSWVNGEYHFPHDGALTLTTNVFSGYGTNLEDVIWVGIYGDDDAVDLEHDSFASESPTANFYSTTIPANSFTAGKAYWLEAGFLTVVDSDESVSLPDALIVAAYESVTEVKLVATPLANTGSESVELIALSKLVKNVQTGADTVIVDPTPVDEFNGGPFGFEISIDGNGLSGIAAPVLTGPINVGEPYLNSGTLVWNEWDEDWGFGWPNGNNFGAPSQAAVDAAFGTGTYSLNVLGVTLPLDLGANAFPNKPQFTLSGGEWIDGKYYIPHDVPLTITTNTFVGFGTSLDGAVWVSIWGDGDFEADEYLALSIDDPSADSYTTTIPANTFTAGRSYELEGGFYNATTLVTDNPSFPGALIVAGFEESTEVVIVATPLPDPEPVTTTIDAAIMIKFDSVDGSTYSIEGSFDMENWFQAHPDVTGYGGEMRFFFERQSPRQYYRVTKLN